MRDDIHIQWHMRLRDMEKVRRQWVGDLGEEEDEDDVEAMVIEVRRPLVDVAVTSSSSSSS
jgi:hypothetical protein